MSLTPSSPDPAAAVRRRNGLWAGGVLFGCVVLGLGGIASSQEQGAAQTPAPPPQTPTALLTEPIAGNAPDAAEVQRGQSLVIAGDCVSCHTRPGGAPMAGGLGLNTPFGVIYSANLTADSATGLGAWSGDQFYRALHLGIGDHDKRLYPAFPYPAFTAISRADSDAMLAYLKTLPPTAYTPPDNRLPFPLNIRFVIRGWNLLFFHPGALQADASKSDAWNRGAYLVLGLGHCGTCHTPKNALGADDTARPLQGGVLENWTAPDLTGNARTGLGGWSAMEIAEYLKTGRNARAQASGPMAEVVSYSTSLMDDQDRAAIAVYLKDRAASPDAQPAAPDAAAMQRGAAIFSDACTSCHLEGGAGQAGYFPPLAGDAVAQQSDPTGVVHMILAGARTAPTPTRPSPLSMPSFAWKLSDQEIADVATYVRNSWGNRSASVDPGQVAKLRRRLDLETVHLTVNSGDRE